MENVSEVYLFYILVSMYKKESIGFVQTFDLRFLMDLHVSGCSEYDLTTFTKSLSVCDTNFVAALDRNLENA